MPCARLNRLSAACRPLERECGQQPAYIGPGVDANTVRAKRDFGADRAAMIHPFKVGGVIDKRLTDPAQISDLFVGEQHGPIHASIDGCIVARNYLIFEAVSDLPVVRWNKGGDCAEQIVEIDPTIAWLRHPAAENGIASAIG